MAGDEVRDRIVRECSTHRTHRRRMTDLPCHPAVRPHLAARNLARLAQDRLLERGQTAKIEAKPLAALQLVMDPDRKILVGDSLGEPAADVPAKHRLKLGSRR